MFEDQREAPNKGVPEVAMPKQGAEDLKPLRRTGSTEPTDLKWNWVEASIWTTSMLTTLDNGVKGGKWFSLIDKVRRPKTLYLAWEKVKANKGAGGVDNIDIEKFESNCQRYLDEVSEALRVGRYQPQAVRRVYIPKAGGGKRPLGISTIKDRVVQMALKMTIEPIFEKEFHEHSYGFRPQRGAKDALRKVDQLLKAGYTHIVDVDFKAYFDTIPHERLIALIQERISDGRVVDLLGRFLKQGVMENMTDWTPTRGTPQGGVISPLLANVYLNPLDHVMAEARVPMIRYADDFVIFAKSAKQAERIRAFIEQWSDQAGLTVHPEKSRVIDYGAGEAFEFLGYCFKQGKRYVRDASLKKLRDAVRSRTRRTSGESIDRIIPSLNRTLRGWYNYFKHSHSNCLQNADKFVRRRLRAVLRKRNKRPGFGATQQDHKRWPNSFFANLGLFTTFEAQKAEKRNLVLGRACRSR